MTLKEYFLDKPYGTKAALARKLGVSKTWLSLVTSGRRIPSAAFCVEVERETGVRRETLRPDLFGDLL
jgi:DNA-binding transcriptional regulator YdaS (Cro superfamily)